MAARLAHATRRVAFVTACHVRMHGARHPSLTGRRWVSSTVPPVPQDDDATGDKEEEEDDDDDDDDDDMDGVFDDEEGRGVYAHNTTYRFMDRARIEVRGGRGGLSARAPHRRAGRRSAPGAGRSPVPSATSGG